MSIEKQFYQRLNETPELPEDLFDKIDTRISKAKTKKRMLVSFAAALLISVGTAGIAVHQNSINSLDAEVVAELEDIWNFMNNDDVDNDLDMYAIIEGF
jgi:hypothetical protein